VTYFGDFQKQVTVQSLSSICRISQMENFFLPNRYSIATAFSAHNNASREERRNEKSASFNNLKERKSRKTERPEEPGKSPVL